MINLIGVLHGSQGKSGARYGREFASSHVELPRRIVATCVARGVDRLLHMSALGADSKGPSMYQRSKGDGEAIVQASALDWTVFRPSVVFGPEDNFLNLFATLAKFFPLLPIGGADARFQPVWVGDVSDAFVNALDKAPHPSPLRTCRSTFYRLRELSFARAVGTRVRSSACPPPWRLCRLLMECCPGALMSRDISLDEIATLLRAPFRTAPELAVQQRRWNRRHRVSVALPCSHPLRAVSRPSRPPVP